MPKKQNLIYTCSQCGFNSGKWVGKCPECGEWNSFSEVTTSFSPSKNTNKNIPIEHLPNITMKPDNRLKTNVKEFDNVMGGGIVPGSLILLGGEPGIGKSTLLLQLSEKLTQYGSILYNNGEESSHQIKLRSQRLAIAEENILLMDSTDLSDIEKAFLNTSPIGAIIDSVQTVYNPTVQGLPASLTQIKEGANLFLKLAKKNHHFIFLIGHVTKDGQIAGPKSLEHIVDVVLYLEGDRHHSFRILRSYKNRFGSTDEIGIFQMTQNGFEEVSNPSKYFIQDFNPQSYGTTLTAIYEGSRPLIVEIQALVSQTHFNYPKRLVDGTELNKAQKLIAILEKVTGLILFQSDVYINITGGIFIKEPGVELSILVAIYSSFKKTHLKKPMILIGEVGLSGEIRGVNGIVNRVSEAIKLGIDTIVIPEKNLRELSIQQKKIDIIPVKTIQDVLDKLF